MFGLALALKGVLAHPRRTVTRRTVTLLLKGLQYYCHRTVEPVPPPVRGFELKNSNSKNGQEVKKAAGCRGAREGNNEGSRL